MDRRGRGKRNGSDRPVAPGLERSWQGETAITVEQKRGGGEGSAVIGRGAREGQVHFSRKPANTNEHE